MAVARMGCCALLPYRTTGVSKNIVKVTLTPAMQHGAGATATAFAALSESASGTGGPAAEEDGNENAT